MVARTICPPGWAATEVAVPPATAPDASQVAPPSADVKTAAPPPDAAGTAHASTRLEALAAASIAPAGWPSGCAVPVRQDALPAGPEAACCQEPVPDTGPEYSVPSGASR